MSAFIVSIAFGGLSESPPESKVMPLPANTTVLAASGWVYSSRTNRGGCTEPMPTARMPPKPSLASSFSSSTCTLRPCAAAACPAAAARSAGTMSAGEVFTRSRTSDIAPARTLARSAASEWAVWTINSTSPGAADAVRYFLKA